MHPAATVHKIFAAVAVSRREFGTFNVIIPPIIKATIKTASPTDLSSVVFVVVNPMSLMIIVENELMTPLGITAANTEIKSRIAFGSVKATKPCFLLKTLFLIPVSLDATRFTAKIRSVLDKKNAVEGESGSAKKITKA